MAGMTWDRSCTAAGLRPLCQALLSRSLVSDAEPVLGGTHRPAGKLYKAGQDLRGGGVAEGARGGRRAR